MFIQVLDTFTSQTFTNDRPNRNDQKFKKTFETRNKTFNVFTAKKIGPTFPALVKKLILQWTNGT